MPAFQQKDPRYKLISKSPRLYRDMATGATLTRSEWEKRTSGQPLPAHVEATARAAINQRIAVEPAPNQWVAATPGDMDDGPTPVADMPPPPPMMQAATTMAESADATTKAMNYGGDALANTIGDALAMCLELVQQTRTAPEHAYTVLGKKEWERLTRPVCRIGMRHLPVQLNTDLQNPDAADAAEFFKGVMYGITAIWTNKTLYDREMRKLEQEYELEYDRQFGSGAYQRARAGAGGVPENAAGSAGQGGGIVNFPVRYGNAGHAGGAAAAGANNQPDGRAAADKIRALYQKYPNQSGRPFGAA